MRLPFLGFVVALAAAPAANAGVYTFTTLSVPGELPSYFGTEAFGINDSGQVVGTYTSIDGLRGFVFDQASATYTTFDDPASTTGTVAQGINGSGQIVGYVPYSTDPFFLRDPTSGAFTGITSSSDQFFPLATGINDSGQILGSSTDGNNRFPTATSFVRDPGTLAFTFLQDPNSGNQTIPNFTIASGINNAGQVVGYFEDTNSAYNGFLFDPTTGMYTTLTGPASTNTMAQGINNSGQVVGYFGSNQHPESFVLDLAADVYTPLSDPDGVSTIAKDINDAGQIVGYILDLDNVPHAFLATPSTPVAVPEPTSMALLGVSIFGLGVARHWRTKSG